MLDFVIRAHDKYEVYVGPRAGHALATNAAVHSLNNTLVIGTVIDGNDHDLVNALLVVKSRDLISGQIAIQDIDADTLASIPALFPNLTVIRDESRCGITLIF